MKMKRKKIVAYLLMGVMAIGSVGAVEYNNESVIADEFDGDVVENPFSELFNESETSEDLEIDKDNVNSQGGGNTDLTGITTGDSTGSSVKEDSAKENATEENLTDSVSKPGKTKVKKAVAKKSNTGKIKIKLKKIKSAVGYQVKISTKKNFKKKKTVTKKFTKGKITFKSSKLKNKSKLYVKARAYRVVGEIAYYGKWSKSKKVKVK